MKNLLSILLLIFLFQYQHLLYAQSETPKSPAELPQETIFLLNESEVEKYYLAKRAFYKVAGIPENVEVDITQFRYIAAYQGRLEQILWEHEMDDLMFTVVFMDIDSVFMEYAGTVMGTEKKLRELSVKLEKLKSQRESGEIPPEELAGLDGDIAGCEEELKKLHDQKRSEKYLSLIRNFETICKYAKPHELPPYITQNQSTVAGVRHPPSGGSSSHQDNSQRVTESLPAATKPKALFSVNEQEWSGKYQVLRGGSEIDEEEK